MIRRSLEPAARAALFRQLATAVRRKIPLQAVLAILAEDRAWFGRGGARVDEMTRRLSAGQPLSTAMAALSRGFAPQTASLVQQAEQAGALAQVLDALAGESLREGAGKKALRRALAWPLTVLMVALYLTIFVNLFVIPQFKDLYDSMGAALPEPTVWLLDFGAVLSGYWWLWAAAVAGFVALLWREDTRGRLGDVACLIPVVRRYVTARFAARLAAWINTFRGDPALQRAALAHLGATSAIGEVSRAATQVEAAMAGGARLSEALQRTSGMPRRVTLFARLGDTLGDDEQPYLQLLELAREEEVEALASLEYRLLLGLYTLAGLSVSLLLLAVYLPVFDLGKLL